MAAAFLVWTIFIARYGTPLWFWILAAVAAVALIAGWLANVRGAEGWAFGFGAVTIVAAVLALFASLFPDVMPSSTDPANSLTIENASSTDVHAHDHDLGGARLPPARARLPGLDVLGVPQARDEGIDRGGSALT